MIHIKAFQLKKEPDPSVKMYKVKKLAVSEYYNPGLKMASQPSFFPGLLK